MGKRVPGRGNKGPEWGARLACYHSNYSKEASVTRQSEERVVDADDRAGSGDGGINQVDQWFSKQDQQDQHHLGTG